MNNQTTYEPALLWRACDGGEVQCLLCSHYCTLPDGKFGKCRLRKNARGKLLTATYGAVEGFAIDPIEKKPFYNFKPGAKVLSFGTPGCNFSCIFCQNSSLSQRAHERGFAFDGDLTNPEIVVEMAQQNHVDGIAYTYSEPTIFFEFARDVILAARHKSWARSLFHVFVSNGFFSHELLDLVEKERLVSAINIDLKFMDIEKYRTVCGGRLRPVLENVKRIWELRELIHMEIINLVIPNENDSKADLDRLCEFLAGISPEIPLHFSRFFPRYHLTNRPPTPTDTLLEAKEIAESFGLKYIYIGNTNLRDVGNTYCPECSRLVIERSGMAALKVAILKDKDSKYALCQHCGERLNVVV